MKYLILGSVLVLISACSAKQETAKVEITDEVFFQACLDENYDVNNCKAQLIKKRVGYECKVSREKSLDSRIRKKSCTTAADREKMARHSDDFVNEFMKAVRSKQTPPGKGPS